MRDDFLDVLDKTQVKHVIGFVQYKMLDRRQLQMATGHQIHNTPRRSGHNIYTTGQFIDLRFAPDAAINGGRTQAQMARQQTDMFINLQGQFARRRDNQRPYNGTRLFFSE
ncbi:MAG: hypothetical protein Q7U13_09345 [Rhodoferax sp.]|nr:hypothetical protein [Rhodoferax sp.]